MNRSQLRTILWLRWRLTCNRIRRLGTVDAIITWAIFAVGCLAALGGSIGGFLLGGFALAQSQPMVLLGVLDMAVFFFIVLWLTSLLVELQRSESIDLTKLLHLPISLWKVLVLNYAVSLFTPSIILTVPALTGLTIGLALARGFRLLLLLPLVLAFVFMVTAWTYCFRGWLSTLIANPRRRRAIIATLTMVMIIAGQIPHLLLNSSWARNRIFAEVKSSETSSRSGKPAGTNLADTASPSPSTSPSKAVRTTRTPSRQTSRNLRPEAVTFIKRLHAWVPLGWPGLGAVTLGEGHSHPAILGTVASVAIGMIGLGWAYRVTIRFYTSAGKTARHRSEVRPAPTRPACSMVSWSLPGLPDDVAALALASLRSLTRAPEMRMMLLMPLLFMILFGSMFFARSQNAPTAPLHALTMPGMVLFILFGLSQMLANQFGFDRDGFRVLVLLPTRRDRVLVAKNLAFLPIVVGIGFPAILVMVGILRLPMSHLVASWAQLLSGFINALMIGNVFSILAPYRFSPDSLQPTKMTGTLVLLGLLCQVLMLMSFAPLLLPAGIELLVLKVGWLPGWPINLLMSILLLAFSATLYQLTRPSLGRLLEQREQRILELVTEQIE